MRASSKVVEAFSVLGLEEVSFFFFSIRMYLILSLNQDASLEVVKTTYKQVNTLCFSNKRLALILNC